jgi:hypothetical protein
MTGPHTGLANSGDCCCDEDNIATMVCSWQAQLAVYIVVQGKQFAVRHPLAVNCHLEDI